MIIFDKKLPFSGRPKLPKIENNPREALRLWSPNLVVWGSQNNHFWPKATILGPPKTAKIKNIGEIPYHDACVQALRMYLL